jgi:pimeloyl-ACP methyl ester carboxylesterase
MAHPLDSLRGKPAEKGSLPLGVLAVIVGYPLIMLIALIELLVVPFAIFWPRGHKSPYIRINIGGSGDKSTAVYIHGFPDDDDLFAEYKLPDRQSISLALPNGRTNKVVPSGMPLIRGAVFEEICCALDGACATSPTGKIVVVAHDWGATYSWKWIMKNPDKVSAVIAFSVGNEFRYDVLEHGPNALIWGYHLISSLPWLIPCSATRRFVSTLMKSPAAGWIGDREITEHDSHHYWYAAPWCLTVQPYHLFCPRRKDPAPLPKCPVLYIRSAIADRIAVTSAFEEQLLARKDCERIVTGLDHWFLMKQAKQLSPIVKDWAKSKP